MFTLSKENRDRDRRVPAKGGNCHGDNPIDRHRSARVDRNRPLSAGGPGAQEIQPPLSFEQLCKQLRKKRSKQNRMPDAWREAGLVRQESNFDRSDRVQFGHIPKKAFIISFAMVKRPEITDDRQMSVSRCFLQAEESL